MYIVLKFLSSASLVALVSGDGFSWAPASSSVIAIRTTGDPAVGATAEELSSTASIPALQWAVLPGCLLSTAAAQNFGSNTADGQGAVWSCGSGASLSRSVARLSPSGDISYMPYTLNSAIYLPRGAAAPDSTTSWYAGDGYAIL